MHTQCSICRNMHVLAVWVQFFRSLWRIRKRSHTSSRLNAAIVWAHTENYSHGCFKEHLLDTYEHLTHTVLLFFWPIEDPPTPYSLFSEILSLSLGWHPGRFPLALSLSLTPSLTPSVSPLCWPTVNISVTLSCSAGWFIYCCSMSAYVQSCPLHLCLCLSLPLA